MAEQRPHAALIHRVVEDASLEVEYQRPSKNWLGCHPGWMLTWPGHRYRLKGQPETASPAEGPEGRSISGVDKQTSQ